MIAAIAKHGNIYMRQPHVYHVASSHSNPITIFDLFDYQHEYFKGTHTHLTSERIHIPKVRLFDNFDEFSKYTREEMWERCRDGEDGKRIREYKAKVEYVEQLCKLYEFATFFKARYMKYIFTYWYTLCIYQFSKL